MAVIYSKWPKNVPTFSIPRPSKIYPNWDFWFDNKPSGNLGLAQEFFNSLTIFKRPHFENRDWKESTLTVS
jgi:hypothetical protein